MLSENNTNPLIKFLLEHLDSINFKTSWHGICPLGPAGNSHKHSGWELIYHLSSSGEIWIDGEEKQAFNAGDINIIPPELPHNQSHNTPGTDLCIIVTANTESTPQNLPMTSFLQVRDKFILNELSFLTSGAGEKSPELLKLLSYRARALFATLLITGNSSGAAQKKSTEEYADIAKKIINQTYTDPGMEINSIAKKTGVSDDYLRHLFKTKLGISPKQYVLKLRIERASELLLYSTLSLKEIAAMSGFANERYLCFYFKQITGNTPVGFRNSKKPDRVDYAPGK